LLLGEETVSSMYSRLFKLPRLSRIVVIGILMCTAMDLLFVLSFLHPLSAPSSLLDILESSLFGFVLLIGAFLISSVLTLGVSRRISEVMNFRRALGVSLFSLTFTTTVFLIGWVLYYVGFSSLLPDFFIFGLAAGFTIRLLVALVTVSGNYLGAIADSLVQPLLEFFLLLPVASTDRLLIFLSTLLIILAIFAVLTSAYVRAIGSQLRRLTGVDGRVFFRSFLSEWSAGTGDQLEEIIGRNSVRKDLRFACFSFRNKRGRMKAIMIVPTVHPGPFKGVGSSNLPAYLMHKLEEDFDCPVVCAHGPSTHGENLVKSSQCKEVYKEILAVLRQKSTPSKYSSQLARATEDGVSVACQIFGGLALLIGSSSSSLPIDDISLAVGDNATSAARRSDIEAFFVDSHSCVNPESDDIWPSSKVSEMIVKASQKAAHEVSKFGREPFRIGAAKIRSTGISRVDGMGEEGVSAIVIQVNEKSIAYVLFDSNNMVPSLRDLLRSELVKTGFDSVEVLTSDTHSTSALTPGKIGYNPLGFSTSHDQILQLSISVANKAKEDAETAVVNARIGVLKGVNVAGEENMQNILRGIRNSIRVAKKLAPISFGVAVLLSIIVVVLT